MTSQCLSLALQSPIFCQHAACLGGTFVGSVLSIACIPSSHCVSFYSLTPGLMGLDLHLCALAMSSNDLKEKGNAQRGLLRLLVECICSPHALRQWSSSWQRAAIGLV